MNSRRLRIAASIALAIALAVGAARIGGVLTPSPPHGDSRPEVDVVPPVEPVENNDKVQAFQETASNLARTSFLVEVESQADGKNLLEALTEQDGRATRKLDGNWYAVELDDRSTSSDLQETLEQKGVSVVTAEPEQVRTPTGPATPVGQWALTAASDKDINAPEAWNTTRGSSAVKVAVIDSGVDSTHPDLKGAVLTGATFNGTQSPASVDGSGHGTAVAGTIAARGTSEVFGAAPLVSILPVKIFGNGDDTGNFSMAGYIAAIDWAVGNGADIINLSVGCSKLQPACFSQAEHDALARAGAAGVLVVASAGNNSRNNDVVPDFPSGYDLPNLVSVAAVDRDFRLASFSQWGPASVDVAAPGVEIRTTSRGVTSSTWSGTSFAAPLVTGTAALIISANPELDPGAVRERLMKFSRASGELSGKVGSGGVIDAKAAVLGQQSTTAPAAPVSSQPTAPQVNLINVLGVSAQKGRPPRLRVRARATSNTPASRLVITVRNKGKVVGAASYQLRSAAKRGKAFTVAIRVKKLPSRRSKLTVTVTEKSGKQVVGRATHRLS